MLQCQAPTCGYIYNPTTRDRQERKIPPGTKFENLPDDWRCPLCGVNKNSLNV
ncbi:rubredoxin [Candidatus Magnetomonas plexicatena]|uniref:rubredoxin n=1 Tax=Candidatus Magnetomonas plexicatena TaxID=2552947 RepID=UPI001C785A03|nr:rubredoxin [Nitrospirales bacterium LBB_01]